MDKTQDTGSETMWKVTWEEVDMSARAATLIGRLHVRSWATDDARWVSRSQGGLTLEEAESLEGSLLDGCIVRNVSRSEV